MRPRLLPNSNVFRPFLSRDGIDRKYPLVSRCQYIQKRATSVHARPTRIRIIDGQDGTFFFFFDARSNKKCFFQFADSPNSYFKRLTHLDLRLGVVRGQGRAERRADRADPAGADDAAGDARGLLVDGRVVGRRSDDDAAADSGSVVGARARGSRDATGAARGGGAARDGRQGRHLGVFFVSRVGFEKGKEKEKRKRKLCSKKKMFLIETEFLQRKKKKKNLEKKTQLSLSSLSSLRVKKINHSLSLSQATSCTAAIAGNFSLSFCVTATRTVITEAAGPVILTLTNGPSRETSSRPPPPVPTK